MARGERINVCIAVSPYPPEFGGHGIQFQRTLPDLEREGIHGSVLTRAPLERVVPTDDALEVHRDLSAGFGRAAQLRRVLEFRRHFRRRGAHYDALHAMVSGWDLFANIGYVRRMGIPIVVEMVLMGSDDLETIGRTRLGATKLGLLASVDLFIGISEVFRPTLAAAGVSEDRFRLVYTGVDMERYRPRDPAQRLALRARLALPADARIAISVGSVMHRKGFDRLIDAWFAAKPEVGRDLLLVAGPASREDGLVDHAAEFARALRARVGASGLAGTVRFTGRVDNVDEWMGAADLFVFLSRREGLGTVILEALATGLPCLVSPLGGIGAELICPERTGLVTPDPDDARAVGAVLRTWLDDPARRQAMGGAARRDALPRFSMRARTEKLAAIYAELASKSIP